MPRKSREAALWEQLVEEAGDDLVDEASRVSVAQAEKELAAAGFDVAEERARAEAFLASLGAAAEEVPAAPKPAPFEAVEHAAPIRVGREGARNPRKKRVPAAVWAVAAAVAAGGAAAIYAETRPDKVTPPAPAPSPAPVPSLTPAPTAPDLLAAVDLRRRAAAALDSGFPAECLALLDEAAAKDPAGDETPDIQNERTRAQRALKP